MKNERRANEGSNINVTLRGEDQDSIQVELFSSDGIVDSIFHILWAKNPTSEENSNLSNRNNNGNYGADAMSSDEEDIDENYEENENSINNISKDPASIIINSNLASGMEEDNVNGAILNSSNNIANDLQQQQPTIKKSRKKHKNKRRKEEKQVKLQSSNLMGSNFNNQNRSNKSCYYLP